MTLILDFRFLRGHFWVATFAPLYRWRDYAERPTGAQTSAVEHLTAEEVGQLLGGN